MTNNEAFSDALLAAIYDEDNPPGKDHEFFRAVATEHGSRHIIDLGCGTGSLTVTLAAPGRDVTGIDPSAAMLDVAKSRHDGGRVGWARGTSDQIIPGSADLVVMSGNVVMHLIGEVFTNTLADVARGLTTGGVLTFESRNPVAQAWREWISRPTERQTAAGRLRESRSTTEPDADGVVLMSSHNEFLDHARSIDLETQLQFRTESDIRAQLQSAGFGDIAVYGDWHRKPFTGTSSERLMVFTAIRV